MKNLKKAALLAYAACSALVLFTSCQNQSDNQYDVSGRKGTGKRGSDESSLESTELKYSGDLANVSMTCTKNEECTMVPAGDACFGCHLKGGSHIAVNVESAKKVFESRKSQCEALYQDENKRPNLKDPETEGSCRMDAAKCVSNICTLVKLSPEEKKKRDDAINAMIEKMKQQEGQKGGQQQPGPSAPQPQPPRQGYPSRQGYPDRSTGYGG